MTTVTTTMEDLVQDSICNLASRLSRYNPDKATFLRWCYYRTIRFAQSKFRKEANRHRCLEELSSQRSPSRKGRVSADGYINSSYDFTNRLDFEAARESTNTADERLEAIAYDVQNEQADPRPMNELLIDLHDSIAQLPAKEQSVILLVLDSHNDDSIGWKLGIHPTTVSAIKLRAIELLRERMTE